MDYKAQINIAMAFAREYSATIEATSQAFDGHATFFKFPYLRDVVLRLAPIGSVWHNTILRIDERAARLARFR